MAGFLRIVTNPRIMAEPEPTETAVAFVDALVAEPGVEVAGGWAWGGLRDRILALGLQGNAIPDAWIAAQAEALMERLVTLDRDFKRLLPSRSLILLTPED